MYVGRPKPKRSRPERVLLLSILILVTLYVVTRRPELITRPFEPTPTPTRTPQSYLEEADAHYRNGELREASDLYERVVSMRPGLVPLYVQWARLLALQGRLDEALVPAQKAVELEDESAEPHAILGMILDWQAAVAGSDEERDALLRKALDECLRAVQFDPNYAEGHAYLAEVYADLVSWKRALQEARTAVSLNDDSVDTRRVLAYVLERQGRYREAVAEYQRAIELHPKLALLYLSLGRNYRVLGEYDEATQQFQKAIQLHPDDPEPYDELGWTYFYQADYELAATQLEMAVEVAPDYAPAYGHLGVTYYVRRNYEKAIPTLKKGIELGLESVEYYYELGLSYVYLDEPDCDDAVPWLERALEIDSSALPAYQGLVLCGERPPLPTETPTPTATP